MANQPKAPTCIVVAESPDLARYQGLPVVNADDYLAGTVPAEFASATVVNLCRSYEYLSAGYYVSLLADARRQNVLPSVADIEEIAIPYAYFRALREAGVDVIDLKLLPGRRVVLPKSIVAKSGDDGARTDVVRDRRDDPDGGQRYVPSDRVYEEPVVVLGKTVDERFRRQAAQLFGIFRVPCMRLRLYQVDGRWRVGQISAVHAHRLSPADFALLSEELPKLRSKRERPEDEVSRLRIACLYDEEDEFAPSNGRAIAKFEKAARERGALLERIGRADLARLAEFDALFIRTLTSIANYTFQFAQTAESLGMPVIDDPESIVRCSNKVYLFELFRRTGIPIPRTRTMSRSSTPEELAYVGYPMVVKVPDGSFSTAVKKVSTPAELDVVSKEMFKRSPLLIVQEFRPTEYDWRVGVLDGRAIYACRYFMARNHWQIAEHVAGQPTREGKVEAVPMADVPPEVISVAVRAAALIGNGLYGVDLKATDNGPMVIEVNDNPNIDSGYEDQSGGDGIYTAVVDCLLARVHAAARPQPGAV